MQISIPTPCHENWDAMTASAQGKFCGACQKEVVDFSGKTDAEILAFFTKYESPCIRIETHRLDKPLAPKYALPHLQTPYRWYRPLLTAALIATLSVTNTYAQGAPIPPKTEQTTPKNTQKGGAKIKPPTSEKDRCKPKHIVGKMTIDKKNTPPPTKMRPKTTGMMQKSNH